MTTASLIVDVDSAPGKKQLRELRAELEALANIPNLSPKFNRRDILSEVKYTLASKKFEVGVQISSTSLDKDIRAAIGQALRYQYKVRIQGDDLAKQVATAVNAGVGQALKVTLAGSHLTDQVRSALTQAAAPLEVKANVSTQMDTGAIRTSVRGAVAEGVAEGVKGIKVQVPVSISAPPPASAPAPVVSVQQPQVTQPSRVVRPDPPTLVQPASVLASPNQHAVFQTAHPAPNLSTGPRSVRAAVSVSHTDPDTGMRVSAMRLFADGQAGYGYVEKLARQTAEQNRLRKEMRLDSRFEAPHLDPAKRLDHQITTLTKVQEALARGGQAHATHQYGPAAVGALPNLAALQAQRAEAQRQAQGDKEAADQSRGAQSLAASRLKAEQAQAQAQKRAQEDALWAAYQGPAKQRAQAELVQRPAGESAWRDLNRSRKERKDSEQAEALGLQQTDNHFARESAEEAKRQLALRKQITAQLDRAAVANRRYAEADLEGQIKMVQRARALAAERGPALAARRTSEAAVRDIPRLPTMLAGVEESRRKDLIDREANRQARAEEQRRIRQETQTPLLAERARREATYEQAREAAKAHYNPMGARVAGAAALVAQHGEATARSHLGSRQFLVDEIGSLQRYARGAKDGAAATKAMRDSMADAHSAARGFAGSLGMIWTTWGNTIPIVAAATLASTLRGVYEEGRKVETQIAFVKGLTGQQLSSASIEKSAVGSNLGMSEATTGLRALTQAGYSGKQALSALPDTLALATVGETDVATAANAATGILKAFNLEIGETSRVSDVLAKASASSNAAIVDMMEAMKYASPASSLYGQTLEEATAAVAVMSEKNIKGSMAGTSHMNMLKELYTPTKHAKKAFDWLGVDVEAMQREGMRANDIIDKIREKAAALDTAGLTKFTGMVFGERGGREAAEYLKIGTGRVREMEEQLRNSQGFTKQVMVELADTVDGSAARVKQALSSALTEAFDNSKGSIQSFNNSLASAAHSDTFVGFVQRLTVGTTNLTRVMVDHGGTIVNVAGAYLALRTVNVAAQSVLGFVNTVRSAGPVLAAHVAGMGASAQVMAVRTGVITAAQLAEAQHARQIAAGATAAAGATTATTAHTAATVASTTAQTASAAAAGVLGTKVGLAAGAMRVALGVVNPLLGVLALGTTAWQLFASEQDKVRDSQDSVNSRMRTSIDLIALETDRIWERVRARRAERDGKDPGLANAERTTDLADRRIKSIEAADKSYQAFLKSGGGGQFQVQGPAAPRTEGAEALAKRAAEARSGKPLPVWQGTIVNDRGETVKVGVQDLKKLMEGLPGERELLAKKREALPQLQEATRVDQREMAQDTLRKEVDAIRKRLTDRLREPGVDVGRINGALKTLDEYVTPAGAGSRKLNVIDVIARPQDLDAYRPELQRLSDTEGRHMGDIHTGGSGSAARTAATERRKEELSGLEYVLGNIRGQAKETDAGFQAQIDGLKGQNSADLVKGVEYEVKLRALEDSRMAARVEFARQEAAAYAETLKRSLVPSMSAERLNQELSVGTRLPGQLPAAVDEFLKKGGQPGGRLPADIVDPYIRREKDEKGREFASVLDTSQVLNLLAGSNQAQSNVRALEQESNVQSQNAAYRARGDLQKQAARFEEILSDVLLKAVEGVQNLQRGRDDLTIGSGRGPGASTKRDLYGMDLISSVQALPAGTPAAVRSAVSLAREAQRRDQYEEKARNTEVKDAASMLKGNGAKDDRVKAMMTAYDLFSPAIRKVEVESETLERQVAELQKRLQELSLSGPTQAAATEIQAVTGQVNYLNSALAQAGKAKDALSMARDAHAETAGKAAEDVYNHQRSAEFGFTQFFRNYAATAMDSAKLVDNVLSSSIGGFEQYITKASTGAKVSFGEAVRSILADSARLAAVQYTRQAIGTLLGMASTAVGAWMNSGSLTVDNSGIGAISAGSADSATGAAIMSRRANGGYTWRNSVTQVVERDVPEMYQDSTGTYLLSPDSPGSVTTLSPVNKSGGQSTGNVNIEFNISIVNGQQTESQSDTSGQKVQGLVMMLRQAVLGVIEEQKLPGGLLYS